MKNKVDDANEALAKMTARWKNSCRSEDALSELLEKKQLKIEQLTLEKAVLEERLDETAALSRSIQGDFELNGSGESSLIDFKYCFFLSV